MESARRLGATALQLFVKSARQWGSRPLGRAEILEFRDKLRECELAPFTLAHGTYLINLASPDDQVWERSIRTLAGELDRCRLLGIPSLVLHPGSHMGSGEEAGLARIARALDRLLLPRRGGKPASGPRVLLEITAGCGTSLGHRFEQIGWLLSAARSSERLGVCFDTCHALAAGYDFRDAQGYRETFADYAKPDVTLSAAHRPHLFAPWLTMRASLRGMHRSA